MIGKVYKNVDEAECQEILKEMKIDLGVVDKPEGEEMHKVVSDEKPADEEAEITFGQAACGKNYKKGTWIIFIWSFFFMWTGIDALNMYSNVIIK